MVTRWQKPNSHDLSEYKKSYIDLVQGGDLTEILEDNLHSSVEFLQSIPLEKLLVVYAPGKWTIPQIIIHLIDTERIFAYRILRIARGDKTNLAGFEQDDYAKETKGDLRGFKTILNEYISVRIATITLLKSLTDDLINRVGCANNVDVTVLELAYMIAGHEIHHMNVIKEKYLS